jgi:hypothetical protein
MCHVRIILEVAHAQRRNQISVDAPQLASNDEVVLMEEAFAIEPELRIEWRQLRRRKLASAMNVTGKRWFIVGLALD